MENPRSRWAAWEAATNYKQATRDAAADAVAKKRSARAAAALQRKREEYLKALKKSRVPLYTCIEDRCYKPSATQDSADVNMCQVNS